MTQIGRYKVTGELGRGAMGVVYHAVDPNIGRPVAIKTIRLSEFATPEERERLHDRLFREARSAGILSHPGIVTVYDVEEREGLAYIAMEFVNGPTLERLLSSGEPLAPDQILQILREAAAALDYAHRKGIVHRDIKPANIMIAETGAVKIADFGIAKIAKSDQLTQTGALLGTPNYMSPEQVQGVAVDGQTDQFSLAVIGYEMLTGERPFAAEQLTTTVYKIVHEEPPGLERLNPALNARIDAVFRTALAKKPGQRFPTCTAFYSALESACLTCKGWKALARGSSLDLPTVIKDSGPEPPSEPVPARRKRAGLYAAAALIGVAIGVGAWMAWQQGWMPVRQQAGAPSVQEQKTEQNPAPPVQRPSALAPPAATTQPKASTDSGTQPQQPQPQTTAAAQPAVAPPPKEPPKPVEPEPEPAQSSPAPVQRTAKAQEILVRTNPAGARLVLDHKPETACTTPCSVTAAPGVHTLTLTREGFQTLQHEITVTQEPFELSPLRLRAAGGILMLTSSPSGAAIFVNGVKVPETTPAQLRLPPGRYKIGMEKEGVRRTEEVDVGEGITRLQLVLE